MKIVVLDSYTLNPGDLSWKPFEQLGEVVLYDRTPPELVTERIAEATAILTNKVQITKEMIATAKKLKYIGVTATGYNIIDTNAAKENGVVVTNVPTYGTMAVAQFAIALLLEICHHIGAHSHAVANGRWSTAVDWCFWDYPLIELANKTMGIIGFGRIGQATGKIAAALGMNILAYDEIQTQDGKKIATYTDLDNLLQSSDVISLHCPLFPTTQGIINKNTIQKMKNAAIIINTSRGPLINEQDLANALNTGKLAYAGLDVLSTEPVNANNPLLKAKNCIITPHIAWAPIEARTRMINIVLDNLKAFVAGNAINVVTL